MKKIAFFLFLVSFIVLNCASMPSVPLTSNDGIDLKGKWSGTRTGLNYSAPTEIEIINDVFPLIGQVTFYNTASGNVISGLKGEIDKGKIQFVSWSDKYWLRLYLYKANGQTWLKGDYQWGEYGGGNISLKKIR